MRQDESGRWVSDNGRYVWSGTEWIDLQAGGSQATATRAADDGTDEPSPGSDTDELQPVPADGGGSRSRKRQAKQAKQQQKRQRQGQEKRQAKRERARKKPRARRSRRPLLFLTILIVLLAVGVGLVLVVGNSSTDDPGTTAPAPVASNAAPGNLPPPPPTPEVLDETQRRERAQSALLRRSDLPGTTEERPSSPTDLFLPCRTPPLVPPTGSVLVGQAVSNADFTSYVGQTIVGFPTARQAADALGQIRTTASGCGAYDYRYANSERVDRITHTDVDQNLALGDGGVYLVEVDTPANYSGSATSYSYGYVQRGQFLVRLTLTNDSKADRAGLEVLMRKTLDRLQ